MNAINKRAVGRGQKSVNESMRSIISRMEQDVKRNASLLSPEVLLGYWDPLLEDRPWTWTGFAAWLFQQRSSGDGRNLGYVLQEAMRSTAVSQTAQARIGQSEDAMKARFRQLYADVCRNAADGFADPEMCTALVCEAIRAEKRQRLQSGVATVHWELHRSLGPSDVRILQHRMVQGAAGQMQGSFYQVTAQFRTAEVVKGFDRTGALRSGSNTVVKREPIWVFERAMSVDTDSSVKWRVCARLGERTDPQSIGSEVEGQVPTGAMKERMAAVWEAQKFAMQSEGGVKGFVCRALFPR